jgi:hypothetical protein
MNILLAALTFAYVIHIVEEYKCGWLEWAQKLSGLCLRKTEFVIANTIVVIMGIACSIIGDTYPLVSLTFAGLAAVNAVFAHMGTTIFKRIWSPGTATSIILFIPLSAWAYVDSYARGVINAQGIFLTIMAGLLIMCVPIAYQVMKNRGKGETD